MDHGTVATLDTNGRTPRFDMKLIYCPICRDVVSLTYKARTCECGQSGGQYAPDGVTATLTGPAIPLGFDNGSLQKALLNRPGAGDGERFEAFVIPRVCPTVKRRK